MRAPLAVLLSQPTHKVCSVCQQDKPIGEYQPTYINKGANKGKISGTFKMCKACTTAKKTEGIRARHAHITKSRQDNKPLPPIVSNITQKQLTQQLAQPTTLSNQLLSLASQVEALEANQTIANQYNQLLSAARDIVVEAEATFGVIVIKQETFTNLEKATINLKDIKL